MNCELFTEYDAEGEEYLSLHKNKCEENLESSTEFLIINCGGFFFFFLEFFFCLFTVVI